MNYYDPEAWEAHEARMAGPEELDDEEQCRGCKSWSRALDAKGYCINCTTDAADGGEENEDMDIEDLFVDADKKQVELDESQLYAAATNLLEKLSSRRLAALKNAIELEQRKRVEYHARELREAEQGLKGIKPRATRSDAGRPRAPKAAEVPA